jgi:hypothetical protein
LGLSLFKADSSWRTLWKVPILEVKKVSQATISLTLDEIWQEVKKCPRCKEKFRNLVKKKLLDLQLKQLLPE